MKFEHQVKSFQELSLEEFHDIIALRIQIFIIEQNCPYQEMDGKDKRAPPFLQMKWMKSLL